MCTALKLLLIVTTLLLVLSNPAAAQKPQDPAFLLDLLLDDYQKYGLPFPPEEAKLALIQPSFAIASPLDKIAAFVYPTHRRRNAVAAIPLSSLNVKIPVRWKIDFNPPYWDVYEEAEVKNYWVDSTVANQLEVVLSFKYPAFSDDQHLILLAILCRQRYLLEVASLFLNRAYKGREADYDPRRELADMAWQYWRGAFEHGRVARGAVVSHLRTILQMPYGLDTKSHRSLVADLTLPVKRAEDGDDRVERLLNRLVNCEPRDFSYPNKEAVDVSRISPYYVELWRLGYDAVPALLKHLDDSRVTRFVMLFQGVGGQSNFEGFDTHRFERISDIVREILYDLSGLATLQPQKLEAWWRELQKFEPAERLVSRALDADLASTGHTPYNPHIIHLIAWQYPERLADLYETMLTNYPFDRKWLVAEMLVSRYPDDTRTADLLIQGAASEDMETWRQALVLLLNLKHAQAVPLLVQRINQTQSQWNLDMSKSPVAVVSQIAGRADDSRVFAALEAMARRADTRRRLEVLESVYYHGGQGARSLHLLQFLAKFLDDTSERVVMVDKRGVPDDPRYFDTYAGSGFPRLKVGDMAAMYIANAVGIGTSPDKTWTNREWKLLHEKVREALKRKRLS